MKNTFAAFTLGACVLLFTASRADAQAFPMSEVTVVDSDGNVVSPPSSNFVPPYSYFAAFPLPARQYVPYGAADAFPYHGYPYGKPYDRWTWASMQGSQPLLQRYYYPPLGW